MSDNPIILGNGRAVLHCGDWIETLRGMPDQSVYTVITSPPYYGLRDYGVAGQLGLEDTPESYVAALVAGFQEVRRVLRDDGTVWLNLGDSYADKQLLGIPWRVAFALQADGWYLRQDIIWHKPNPMPESVTDRCTKAHEYVFLLTKSARYWYDNEAVREESSGLTGGAFGYGGAEVGRLRQDAGKPRPPDTGTRNRRTVWTISTRPYSGAHFATMPPDLVRVPVLAGCPSQCCPACGAGWERVVEKTGGPPNNRRSLMEGKDNPNFRDGNVYGATLSNLYREHGYPQKTTLGFRPTCACGRDDSVSGVVLDPFGGSGTTAEVALSLGRHAVLIELNPEYVALQVERVGPAAAQPLLWEARTTTEPEAPALKQSALPMEVER